MYYKLPASYLCFYELMMRVVSVQRYKVLHRGVSQTLILLKVVPAQTL